jgi:hypothetical protein
MIDDLKQPDTLGELVDTESLGWSFRQTFITDIIVSTEEADDSIGTSEELARIARDEIYAAHKVPAANTYGHPSQIRSRSCLRGTGALEVVDTDLVSNTNRHAARTIREAELASRKQW